MDPMNGCYHNIKNNWNLNFVHWYVNKQDEKYFPKEILLIIYKSLIMPHLNYGFLLWGVNLRRSR